MRPDDSEDLRWRARLKQGPLSKGEGKAFAGFVLTRVSRTFALNIRVLPQPLRMQILYAYLYCRMADTLEDDAVLLPAEKIRLLRDFAALFILAEEGDTQDAAQANPFVPSHEGFIQQLPREWRLSLEWEHLLLIHAPALLNPLSDFPKPVRFIVSQCVIEMCEGMAEFTGKQARIDHPNLIETLEELDTYCYYVAGTVGKMLCELFILHSGRIDARRGANLRNLCVSFGVGLQLTNILKDLQEDQDRNVSWLPRELLVGESLTLADFLHSPLAVKGRRRIYTVLFAKAKKHLEDALEYSCLLPRSEMRLRLFCIWPLLMAAETLVLLAENTDALVSGVRLKIPRRKVESIVRRTRLLGWSNRWVHSEFRKPMLRLEKSLQGLTTN